MCDDLEVRITADAKEEEVIYTMKAKTQYKYNFGDKEVLGLQ